MLNGGPPGTVRIDLEPAGRRIEVPAGRTVLEAAQAAGVEMVAICGGTGICGCCRVRAVQGELAPLDPFEEEELGANERREGWRLACRAHVHGDVRIEIPPESLAAPQRLHLEGLRVDIAPDGPFIAVDVRVDPPSLYDLRSDATRLASALDDIGRPAPTVERAVLAGASTWLREHGWALRAVLQRSDGDEKLVAVLPRGSIYYGLAADLGTTKLAAYLVDLEAGRTVARTGAMNPQIAFGEDVVSRIAYSNQSPAHQETLQARLVASLNAMVGVLCDDSGVRREQIVDAVVVGNTAIHHLLAGLPVRQLGEAPYVPVITDALEMPAREIGLRISAGASLYLPPNIAGYVGADHVAMLLATAHLYTGRTVLGLDIGTNTEITLAHGDRLTSCSCASGPAFEGAHIRDGVRALPGAVERVRYAGGAFHVHTIGDLPAVGICGSGILDTVAALMDAGLLDSRGVLLAGDQRIQRIDGQPAFELVPADRSGHGYAVSLTRGDVHEVQLAKGAIRAGIEVLLGEAGLRPEEVDAVLVAGAFGTYLDVRSALRVGMFPAIPAQRFQQVGNAAGMGALMMLCAHSQRLKATKMARRVRYVELTTHAGFKDLFTEGLFLQ